MFQRLSAYRGILCTPPPGTHRPDFATYESLLDHRLRRGRGIVFHHPRRSSVRTLKNACIVECDIGHYTRFPFSAVVRLRAVYSIHLLVYAYGQFLSPRCSPSSPFAWNFSLHFGKILRRRSGQKGTDNLLPGPSRDQASLGILWIASILSGL